MLEREAVFLLCGHAAKQPSDRALVQTALDMLAARLNYPSRSSLMSYHMQTLFFDWCSNGYSLHQFLAIQVSSTNICDVSHAAIVSAVHCNNCYGRLWLVYTKLRCLLALSHLPAVSSGPLQGTCLHLQQGVLSC